MCRNNSRYRQRNVTINSKNTPDPSENVGQHETKLQDIPSATQITPRSTREAMEKEANTIHREIPSQNWVQFPLYCGTGFIDIYHLLKSLPLSCILAERCIIDQWYCKVRVTFSMIIEKKLHVVASFSLNAFHSQIFLWYAYHRTIQ